MSGQIASGFAHGTAVDPEYRGRSLGGETCTIVTLYPVAEREVVGLRDMTSLPHSKVVGCAYHGRDHVFTFMVHYEHPDNLPSGRSRLFRWLHVISSPAVPRARKTHTGKRYSPPLALIIMEPGARPGPPVQGLRGWLAVLPMRLARRGLPWSPRE